jgi:hypothetical protein
MARNFLPTARGDEMATSLDRGAMTAQEQLAERLADPRTVDSLLRLLDRLDVIAFTAEALEGFLKRAEVVADSIAQGVADLRRLSGDDTGADLLSRLPQLARAGLRMADAVDKPEISRLAESGLIERLAEPRTIEAAKTLIDKLELVAFTLEALDGFLRRGDEIATSMAEGSAELKDLVGGPGGERVRQVLGSLPDLVDAGSLLAEAGMFEPKTVQVLAQLGRNVAESYDEVRRAPEQAPIGMFGLLRALKDPQVARSIRLALAVAQRYGRELEKK